MAKTRTEYQDLPSTSTIRWDTVTMNHIDEAVHEWPGHIDEDGRVNISGLTKRVYEDWSTLRRTYGSKTTRVIFQEWLNRQLMLDMIEFQGENRAFFEKRIAEVHTFEVFLEEYRAAHERIRRNADRSDDPPNESASM